MRAFYTQEFLEYMALSMSTMPAVFSKGNIDGCTITDNIVLGPYATMSGKKQKVKVKSSENVATFTSAILDKKHTNQVWDFSTSTDYTTTTEFFYQTAPSVGMGRMLFESVFNSNSTFLAIPFESTNDFPGSISDDYGGTSPSIYWEITGSDSDYWNHTVAMPTIINGTSIQLYFNESTPEFQCTIPTFILGFGSNPDEIDGAYKKPFGGYLLVNDSIITENNTKLIIYAGVLDEVIEVGSNASIFQSIISLDVVVV
jgi:hypothetical protein